MEAKLKEYRTIRRRKEIIDNAKEKIEKSKEKIINYLVPKAFRNMENKQSLKEEKVLLLENEEVEEPPKQCLIMDEIIDPAPGTEEKTEENQESWKYFTIKWSIYALIWITLYLYFLSLQFGAVFFVISALIAICVNTRTRPRKKGEVSAYSVFNQNCVSIDGTLKAEQFEREIMYGPGNVRAF